MGEGKEGGGGRGEAGRGGPRAGLPWASRVAWLRGHPPRRRDWGTGNPARPAPAPLWRRPDPRTPRPRPPLSRDRAHGPSRGARPCSASVPYPLEGQLGPSAQGTVPAPRSPFARRAPFLSARPEGNLIPSTSTGKCRNFSTISDPAWWPEASLASLKVRPGWAAQLGPRSRQGGPQGRGTREGAPDWGSQVTQGPRSVPGAPHTPAFTLAPSCR